LIEREERRREELFRGTKEEQLWIGKMPIEAFSGCGRAENQKGRTENGCMTNPVRIKGEQGQADGKTILKVARNRTFVPIIVRMFYFVNGLGFFLALRKVEERTHT
jgi:hypothetical protein